MDSLLLTLVVATPIVAGQDYCQYTFAGGKKLDFGPVRDAGTFTGHDSTGGQMAFNMCTTSTGADCSFPGFQALATQSGSFGCAIASEWTPAITPPQWVEITNGVQLTVQNGDACPDGIHRGITVQFTCDGAIGPATFSVAEPVSCLYEWAFPTSAACTGAVPPAPAPHWSPAQIAARNFGCGHISCGWMFLILIPLVSILAFAIALPLNKFVFKKDATWLQAIPLTVVGPAMCVNFYWGVRFLLCNCKGKAPTFRRWNCPSGDGNEKYAAQDHGDDEDDGATYQEAADDKAGAFDDI